MLHNRLPAALIANGFSEAQVAHALRIGGPLDDIRHRTWCGACGRSVETTLRMLLVDNGRCKCGGLFHVGDKSRDIVEEIAGRLVPNPTGNVS